MFPAKVSKSLFCSFLCGFMVCLKRKEGDYMCTMAQLDNIYKQMTECYRSVYGIDLKEIFLYGSYARDDFNEDSDIDIAAIVKGNRVDLQEKLKKVWDISADIGLENDVVVSPIVIPFDEFEEYKDKLPYYMNILKEGKRIG